MTRLIALSLLPIAFSACGRPAPSAKPAAARNLVVVTIDTLRADHVGAYGYARSQASFVDRMAQLGATFDRAYAAAPITLPSHATLMTGRYPPGHGSRDNGMHVSRTVPTLATELKAHGFRTAAFVAAFPLDHQFGLDRGFDVYSDRLPRGPDGKQANERPASQVVNEAIAWISTNVQGSRLNAQQISSNEPRATSSEQQASSTEPRVPSTDRFFLWLHVFEPHAPYGDASDRRPVLDRYDQEIGVANRELMRLLDAIDGVAQNTLVVVAGDHGEAFGEHGEFSHSIFVYDTTLRVPLVMRGPGVPVGKSGDRLGSVIADPVTLADVAPTAMRLLGFTMADADGIDLSPALAGGTLPRREIYAESFAPLMEFGWAPLRAIRSGPWKFIAAPKPELFDVEKDASERTNLVDSQPTMARDLDTRANRYSAARLPTTRAIDASGLDRLRALGYANGPRHDDGSGGIDPKDRRDMAARIAQVTSGELSGPALLTALEQILATDASNSQAHLRLGFALLQSGNCPRAEYEFTAAINGGLPSADGHMGLATCLGRRNDLAGVERVLTEARGREPDNPALAANFGILQAAKGNLSGAIATLKAALDADPNLHEARFNLALAYAKAGRRAEAAAAARDLLARLPPSAPERGEVERLLKAVQ
jgi:arylsulfatase A-like enzyme/cytochrome c-type biogenesis protein CcmH/NrfG